MKEALILFAIGFIVACWIFVIGHQLGVSAFHDVEGLAQASIPIAYTTAALTGRHCYCGLL